MRNYEIMYILKSDLDEEARKNVNEELAKIITNNGGKIVNEESWGLKKLAYPIEKKTTGFYQLVEFEADPTVIAKLEVNYRRDERVLRFLTLKQEKYAAEYAAKRRSLKTKKED